MIKVPSTLSASSVVSWCVPSKKREFSANGSLLVSVFHSQPHISAVCLFTNPRSHIQSLGRVCSLEVPGPTRYKGSLGTHCTPGAAWGCGDGVQTAENTPGSDELEGSKAHGHTHFRNLQATCQKIQGGRIWLLMNHIQHFYEVC